MKKFGGLPEDQNGCSDPNILVDRKQARFWSQRYGHGKPGTHQWRGKAPSQAFNSQIFPVYDRTVEGRWTDLE